MAFIKSQPQGTIVQAIINLREHQYYTPEAMTEALNEYDVTWKMLKEHRKFVEGVWSGFTWPEGLEATFWRMLISYKEVMVLVINSDDKILENTKENLIPA